MKGASFLSLLLLLCPFLTAFPTETTTQPSEKRPTVGVCIMDAKAGSKQMKSLLKRLERKYDIATFGDEVITNKNVEDWPSCDFLISFFSKDFPLAKAMAYVKSRQPYCVNDLSMQEVLFDRRRVLSVLDAIEVPTPKRLVAHRGSPPVISEDIAQHVKTRLNCDLLKGNIPQNEKVEDDALIVDGQRLDKPFVEKPADSENHEVNILYRGGGRRKLFRKIGDQSSEWDGENSSVRTDGPYIYEEFLNLGDDAVDVKVYMVGPDYIFAETRKSPVVDGKVERDDQGKEIRRITELTPEEREMAKKIYHAFDQKVCGFDILRFNGKSYVIDVNGWSFVKGSEEYYDNAAKELDKLFASKTASKV